MVRPRRQGQPKRDRHAPPHSGATAARRPSNPERTWYLGIGIAITALSMAFAKGTVSWFVLLTGILAVLTIFAVRLQQPTAEEWTTNQVLHWAGKRYTVRLHEVLVILCMTSLMWCGLFAAWRFNSRFVPYRQPAGYVLGLLAMLFPVYIGLRLVRRGWRAFRTDKLLGSLVVGVAAVFMTASYLFLGKPAYLHGTAHPARVAAALLAVVALTLFAGFWSHKWRNRAAYPAAPPRQPRVMRRIPKRDAGGHHATEPIPQPDPASPPQGHVPSGQTARAAFVSGAGLVDHDLMKDLRRAMQDGVRVYEQDDDQPDPTATSATIIV